MSKKNTAGDIIAKVTMFGVAGWVAENALCGDRYSALFRGHKVPFLPIYAAGGLVVTTASPYVSEVADPRTWVRLFDPRHGRRVRRVSDRSRATALAIVGLRSSRCPRPIVGGLPQLRALRVVGRARSRCGEVRVTDGERIVWATSYAIALDRNNDASLASQVASSAIVRLRETALRASDGNLTTAEIDERLFIDEIVNVP